MHFSVSNTLLKTGRDPLRLNSDHSYKSVSFVDGINPVIQQGRWNDEGNGKISLENYDWLFDDMSVEKNPGSKSYHLINFDQSLSNRTSFDMDRLHKYIYRKVQ